MAKVNQRLWKLPGQRTRRKAWGYTAQVGGKQQRRYSAEWSKEDAERALAAALLGVKPAAPAEAGMTFGQAVERYLVAKARKRTIAEDRRQLGLLKTAFGVDTPLAAITAARISDYKTARLAAVRTDAGGVERRLSAAGINRPLAALRHLLRLAHEEWEAIGGVPRIRLEREPQGRIRWLEPAEEARLLAACRVSRTKHLAGLVTVALESGMRPSENYGLTWDRVDLSRGVLRLEETKSGRRREVPMRQAVDGVLAALQEPRTGRVWPPGNVRTAFESAVRAAGLRNFNLADCRHHFASWYIMRGGSLPSLQQVLGHRDIKMTLRYAHLAPEFLRAEIAKTERPAASETALRSTQASTQEPRRRRRQRGVAS